MVPVRIHFLFIMLLLACNIKAQEKYTLTGSFINLPFTDFVSKVESLLPVKFFYKEEWVSDLKVSDHTGCTTLNCILDRVLTGTTLHYLIEESGNIVITNMYAIKLSAIPETSESRYLLPGEGDDYSGTQAEEIDVIEIGNPAEKYRAGQVALSGYITDEDTRESLAGVTVFSRKLSVGAISNEFGFYTLTLPRGSHLIQFTSIGMKDKTVGLNLNGAGEMNVQMKSTITPLKAVIVNADKSITLQRFEVGAERINIHSFKLLPTTLGELDIMKSILLIPGVKSVGEGSTGFNVRGGTADQNLILLYGAPVYNSSHFFGFFSAVNSDIIKDVTLYKGGIPARYGGRISSVLDIGTKEGNRKEFGGNAGISPITAHLMVEGPIIKDTLTYLFAARTTYSNWILDLINDPALHRSKATFYDLNGKITYDLNKNNRIDLSGYYSHDDFRFNYDSTYRYNNHIYALKWRHFFNSHFFATVFLNNSAYHYNISSEDNLLEAFQLSHILNSTSLKTDFNRFVGKSEINFGLDMTRYSIHPGDFGPNGDSSLVIEQSLAKEQAWEGALYFDDKITLSDLLAVEAGIRVSGFHTLHPTTFYIGPEFRLAMNLRMSDQTSFKINYNRTRQYLHLLSNSAAIAPTDIWKLSDVNLLPQIGGQFAAGYYKTFRKSHFEFSAELYFKNIRNLIDFKGGANLVMNENIEDDVVPVKGKAYGFELTLKKTEGKLRYNLGYTFSRIFQKSVTASTIDRINSGQWFPANFDKPHDLVITANYLISRRVSFSGNYTWSSGRPITFPIASYIIYDNHMVHYSDRNKYRIPDYSRLDLSFTLNGNLRSNKLANPKWTFSVYNVLARKNVYSIFFKKDGDVIKGYKLSVFGRAIPSITYSFDF